MKSLFCLVILLLSISVQASSWRNYTDPKAPIYSDTFSSSSLSKNNFRVVTLNLHWSQSIPGIVELLKTHADLRDADAYLLQEVVGVPGSSSAHAAYELAKALELNYVYVPAFIHKQNEQDFGVAILSPHPMKEFTKIILPYPHFIDKTQRVAVGATIEAPFADVRTYSIHAETLQFSLWRKRQVDKVFQDANLYQDPLILGGDFNTAPVWQKWILFNFAQNRGWDIATKSVKGATFKGAGGLVRFKLDHIFSKNIRVNKAGKVRLPKLSNHDFLWSEFILQ